MSPRKEKKNEVDPLLLNNLPHEEISEYDVFAGDEDFYKLLSDSLEMPEEKTGILKRNSRVKTSRDNAFSWLQRIIMAGIITVAITMGFVVIKDKYGLFRGPASSVAGQMQTST